MKINDWVIGVSLIVAGAVVFAMTLGYPTLDNGYPGPALFPRILACLLAICGASLIWGHLQLKGARDKEMIRMTLDTRGLLNVTIAGAVVVVYLVIVGWTGFIIAAGLLAIALMLRLGVRTRTSVFSAALAVGFIYVLFVQLLRVPLIAWPSF